MSPEEAVQYGLIDKVLPIPLFLSSLIDIHRVSIAVKKEKERE